MRLGISISGVLGVQFIFSQRDAWECACVKQPSHLPFRDWCETCVKAKSRDDYSAKVMDEMRDDGKPNI